MIKSLKEKHTVILSSHILSEVSAVCDYILIISHGKLVASDTPDNLSQLALGSNTLKITVKGTKETVEAALKEMENLEEYQIKESSNETDAVDVTIKTVEKTDVREDVFYKMSEVRCPILQMQMNQVSLENIFLELTEDSDKEEEKPERKSFFKKKREGFLEKKELEEEEILEKGMTKMLAVYKKELKTYFTSVIGYLFISFILVLIGIYFTSYNIGAAYPKFEVTLSAGTFVFLIAVPILTMRILAEERRQKTDQLLFTSPVSIGRIVMGKYLALVTIYLVPLLYCAFIL